MTNTRNHVISFTPPRIQIKTLTTREKLDIGAKRGVEAGILMGVYQWMLHVLQISDVLPLQILCYAYLALVLLRSIRKRRPQLGKKNFLPSLLTLGGFISLFAALTLLLTKSTALIWLTYATDGNLQIKYILKQIIPQAGIVLMVGCLTCFLFWRFFRYPRIED